jgi:hypothetical protein
MTTEPAVPVEPDEAQTRGVIPTTIEPVVPANPAYAQTEVAISLQVYAVDDTASQPLEDYYECFA